MKKITLLICFLFPLAGFSQKAALQLTDIVIKKKGEALDAEKAQTILLLTDGKQQIVLYSSQEKVGFFFTYKKKGERVKLAYQAFVIRSNGVIKKAKKKKDVVFLSTGYTDNLSNLVSENILTDKSNLTNYFISFHYVLNFNQSL